MPLQPPIKRHDGSPHVAALTHANAEETIFVGQIYNRSWPADAPQSFLPPLVRAEDAPLVVEQFKSIMKHTAAAIGARYIDAGIASFEGSDFVDSLHFAARGSRKFAALVAKQVGDYCQ